MRYYVLKEYALRQLCGLIQIAIVYTKVFFVAKAAFKSYDETSEGCLKSIWP